MGILSFSFVAYSSVFVVAPRSVATGRRKPSRAHTVGVASSFSSALSTNNTPRRHLDQWWRSPPVPFSAATVARRDLAAARSAASRPRSRRRHDALAVSREGEERGARRRRAARVVVADGVD